jgi:hypothetical protein
VTFCEYLVTGRRPYRGHNPGTKFEARHDPAKQRGILRGDIRLIRTVEPAVPAGAVFPDGWLPPPDPSSSQTAEAAEAASHLHEGG